MTDQVMTSSVHTAAIVPELWSAKYYEVLLARLPFVGSISTDYEEEIKALGDVVNISSVPEFSDADDLAEDAAGDADAITITGQQLTINKRTFKDFIVTKKSQLQSLAFMDKVRDKAVFAIMKKVNADIIVTSVPSTSAPDHQIAFDSGTTYALADMLEGKELLDLQDVPDDGRIQLMGGRQWNDLFNITGFTSRDFIPAGSPNATASFTTPLLGFASDWTTELGNEVFQFHPLYLTMAMQQGLNVSVFDLGVMGKRADRVNSDILWGLKQLDNKRVVKIS